MTLLSIIIPVYRVEQYLRRCVDSVLIQQTPASAGADWLEVILVDDGSPDTCPAICDQYAGAYPMVRVVHQLNGGLSAARNAGLRIARGEYVAFLDSDDQWLLPDGISRMLAALASRPTDVMLFKRVDIYPNRENHECDYDTEFISTHSAEEVFRHLVVTQRFNMSACFQLVRRTLLIENDLFFPVGMLSEDVDWSMRLWQHVDSVSALNIDLYGYYHREGSITTTYTIRNLRCYDQMFRTWQAAYVQSGGKMRCADTIMAYMANLYVSCLYASGMVADTDVAEMRTILLAHNTLLRYAASPKAQRAQHVQRWLGTNMMLFVFRLYGTLKRKLR